MKRKKDELLSLLIHRKCPKLVTVDNRIRWQLEITVASISQSNHVAFLIKWNLIDEYIHEKISSFW